MKQKEKLNFDSTTIYTLAEVAVAFQVAKRTVYKLVKEGVLPCKKVGGQYRFTSNSLKNFIIFQEKRV